MIHLWGQGPDVADGRALFDVFPAPPLLPHPPLARPLSRDSREGLAVSGELVAVVHSQCSFAFPTPCKPLFEKGLMKLSSWLPDSSLPSGHTVSLLG